MADKTLSRNYNERKTWIYRMSQLPSACRATDSAGLNGLFVPWLNDDEMTHQQRSAEMEHSIILNLSNIRNIPENLANVLQPHTYPSAYARV